MKLYHISETGDKRPREKTFPFLSDILKKWFLDIFLPPKDILAYVYFHTEYYAQHIQNKTELSAKSPCLICSQTLTRMRTRPADT